jgi:carboxypeptidase B
MFQALFLLNTALANRVSYDDYLIVRYPPDAQPTGRILHRSVNGIDVLEHKSLTGNGTVIADMYALMNPISAPMLQRQLASTSDITTKFLSFNEIDEYMTSLPVQKRRFGTSFENRTLHAFEFGAGTNITSSTLDLNVTSSTPTQIINCGIHAREWISPSFCMYFTTLLVAPDRVSHGLSDVQLQDLEKLKSVVRFVVIPVLNPDGYEYARDVDRLWRKNRQTNPGNPCVGTDLNRNLDASWSDQEGASVNPCSDTYKGTAVFSAPEAKALGDLIRAYTVGNNAQVAHPRTNSYLDVHSFGQFFLYPQGDSCRTPTEHVQTYSTLSTVFKNTIAQRFRTRYTIGNSCEALYKTTGATTDFSYRTGIVNSFVIELRDTGGYAFIIPESEIVPTVKETSDAVIELYKSIAKMGNLASFRSNSMIAAPWLVWPVLVYLFLS